MLRTYVLVAATLLTLSACKKSDAPTATAAPIVGSPVDAATAASISGTVKFEGDAPKPRKINMATDPGCHRTHAGDIYSEDVVINPDNTLRWVYVYVSSGLGNLQFPVPSEPAVLDQKGCIYTPHMIAVQAGQTISIKNSDPVLHNVRAAAKNNENFNIGQPIQGMVTPQVFQNPEVAISLHCDVHPWMVSWVAVQAHPYGSVTDANGAFSLNGLPPGTYELTAWHEKYGTTTQTDTVGTKESRTIDFVFKATP